MSAAHNVAGMFPPTNKQVWNESLLWRAIPIHTIPEELDYVLAAKKPCPLYNRAYEEYKTSDEIKSILERNQSTVEYLEKHVGMKIDSIETLKDIYQALWIEQLKEFP